MPPKAKSIFACQSCGTQFPKWVGRCTGCGEWDTVAEETEIPETGRASQTLSTGKPPVSINKITTDDKPRLHTHSTELDCILGGGIVPGSLTLVGGDPGIGKSTLLLQVSDYLARKYGPVLYASGEESVEQIRLRARRLGAESDRLLVFAENDLTRILAETEKGKPSLLVVDSIQTVFDPGLASAQGSVGQVRECAARLMHAAKRWGVPVFLIGHVTREGTIAGPRVLEHIVDTVLYFEGDRNLVHRVVRVIKNRFGPANEIAVFEMRPEGLTQVLNPSEVFLTERRERAVGSVVACAMEGTRPLLIEVQALASRMNFNYPQRTCAGLDPKRLSLISAVLERMADYPLSQHDIYVNIMGGLKVDDPGMDLPLACAVLSSFLNKPVDRKVCAIGEIGLSGEVRSAGQLETRLREAQKMGFNRILLSENASKKIAPNPALTLHGIRDVNQIAEVLF